MPEPVVEKRKSFMKRLQHRWGLNSLWQVVAVLLVFALTGSTIVRIKPFVLPFMPWLQEMPGWLATTLYLVLMLPVYQLFLLFFGFLFGQFSFFWEKEKKLWYQLQSLWRRK